MHSIHKNKYITMFNKIFVFTITFIIVYADNDQNYGAYSYHKFSGPVIGDIHEILVPRKYYQQGQNTHAIDYVAKPSYNYEYGVEDPHTGNVQSHQEVRDGDAVSGQYSIMEPNGSIRVVKYTADDKNGFKVNVEYIRPGSQQ